MTKTLSLPLTVVAALCPIPGFAQELTQGQIDPAVDMALAEHQAKEAVRALPASLTNALH